MKENGVFGPILSDYEDGEPLDAQFVHLWKVRDAKVVGFQQYTDTAPYNRLA